MTKEQVEKNIEKDLKYYSYEQFEKDVADYISATKQGRMCCVIHSVAKSGMSRVLSFKSCEQSKHNSFFYNYRQYTCLFVALGYKDKGRGEFRIGGCGINIPFHTNYCIIHDLHRLGFITKEDCEILAQKTPTVL